MNKNEELLVALKDAIVKELNSHTWDDELESGDSCVFDLSGSNVDDAYEGGVRSGRKDMAYDLTAIILRYEN